ncbi:hypothetical protein EVAR_94251_1 [Eumeta japonica]|uniref:Uncharacterized protein n=1 Tax=Eumeta variegata TaxID=151549 RepID=A0A4C1UP63_EUMVA|nr:hypothetical protein EVAR_94251_1 [Eumeta japonica]
MRNDSKLFRDDNKRLRTLETTFSSPTVAGACDGRPYEVRALDRTEDPNEERARCRSESGTGVEIERVTGIRTVIKKSRCIQKMKEYVLRPRGWSRRRKLS